MTDPPNKADEQSVAQPATGGSDRPTILVPIEVLTGETLPDGVPELLANARVVLLGYHVLPEQTPPGQARLEFEDRAQRKLEAFQAAFEAAGAVVERHLVFTHSEQQTLDRKIYEYDCLAVLVPNACEPPEDVLVAIKGAVGLDRIVDLVAGLFADTDVTVTLYQGQSADQDPAEGRSLLDAAKMQLVRRGLDASTVECVIDDEPSGADRIAELGADYDAVVVGETDPSVVTFVFGMPSKQIADRFLGPVIVVQRPRDDGARGI